MSELMDIRSVLVLLLAAGTIVAVVAVFIFGTSSLRRQREVLRRKNEPIPGGGGSYTMYVTGMEREADKNAIEAALNAFQGIHAAADPETGTVLVRYAGYPDLTLLDRLQEAVERAGYPVKEIS